MKSVVRKAVMILPAPWNRGHVATHRSPFGQQRSISRPTSFDYQDFLKAWCPTEENLKTDITFTQDRVRRLRYGWEIARVRAACSGQVLATAQDELDRLEHGRVQVDGAIQVYNGWSDTGLDMS